MLRFFAFDMEKFTVWMQMVRDSRRWWVGVAVFTVWARSVVVVDGGGGEWRL
jgi:hypothetical protein